MANKILQKLYEGTTVRTGYKALAYINAEVNGNITELNVFTDVAISGTATFDILVNGVSKLSPSNYLTITDSRSGSKTGLTIPVVRGDIIKVIAVAVPESGIPKPVSIQVTIDDGTTEFTTEGIQDLIAAMFISGSHTSWVYDDVAGTLKVDAVQLTDEEIQDKVAALIQEGTNVTVTYNDGANTLTIASTATGGHTQEEIEDIIAGLLQEGSNVTLVYDDSGNSLTVSASGGGGGTELPEGDLNAETNTVEKIQGREIDIPEDIGGISDDFAGTSTDNTKWILRDTGGSTTYTFPHAYFTQSGGKLQRTSPNGDSRVLLSKNPYDFLDGSYVIFEIADMQYNNECFIGIGNTNTGLNNGTFQDKILFRVLSGGTIQTYKQVDGGSLTQMSTASVTQANFRYLRIRRSGTSCVLEYSSNGSSWTTAHTEASVEIFDLPCFLYADSSSDTLSIYSITSNLGEVGLSDGSALLYNESEQKFEPKSPEEQANILSGYLGGFASIDGKDIIIPESWTGKNGYVLQFNEYEDYFEFLPKDRTPISSVLITDISAPIWAAYEAFRETGLTDLQATGTLTDQTGNSRHATQATGANQPLYRTGILNTLPVWSFTGSPVFVTLPDMSALTELEVWHVWINLTSTGDTATGLHKFGTDSLANHIDYNDRTIYDDFGRTSRRNYSYGYTANVVDLRKWNISGFISTSSENSFYYNGVQKNTTASNTVSISSAPTIGKGGAQPMTMYLAATYIFSAKLDSTQRAAMRDYVNGKFGITMS